MTSQQPDKQPDKQTGSQSGNSKSGEEVRPLRVVLAGGGTAGHVNPLLALAAYLEQRDVTVIALGNASGIEADLVPGAGIELRTIERVPFPRRPNRAALTFPARWRRSVAQARAVVEGADVVVGFGGHVATPAYIAARRCGVPTVVHEQNARPGLANRVGARKAAVVATTFPGTPLPKAQLVGMPIREAVLAAGDLPREESAAFLGLDLTRPVLLVSGGSLGAAHINGVIAGLAAEIVQSGFQVLHLTGRGKAEAVTASLAKVSQRLDTAQRPEIAQHYNVREYLVEMQHALACAALVVGRAGAGAVSEFAALGIPAIYVPLPIGNGEQRLNAAAVVEAGGGILVADDDFTPAWGRTNLLPLLGDPARLAQMAGAARSTGIRDGAARLGELVLGVAR